MNSRQTRRAEFAHATVRRIRTATLMASPEQQGGMLADGNDLARRLGSFIFHAEQHRLTIREQFAFWFASIKSNKTYEGYPITSQMRNTSETAIQRASTLARDLIGSIAGGYELRLSDDTGPEMHISSEAASEYVDAHPNWVSPLSTDRVFAEIACLGLELAAGKRPTVYPAVTSPDGSEVLIAADAPSDSMVYVDMTSERPVTSVALARELEKRLAH